MIFFNVNLVLAQEANKLCEQFNNKYRWLHVLSFYSKSLNSIEWLKNMSYTILVMDGTLRTDLKEDGEDVFEIVGSMDHTFHFQKNNLPIRTWKTPSPSSSSSPP